MALADYQPRRHQLVVDGQPLCTLRGLTTPDIAVLVEAHHPDLLALMDLINVGRALEDGELMTITVSLLQHAPGVAANIIAIASDEPTSGPVAEKLPFPVQLEALQAIGDMTFTEAASVKKTLGVIAALLQKTNVKKMGTTKTAKKKAR